MDMSQALEASEIVMAGLGQPQPLVPSELTAMRSLLLPVGCQAVFESDTPDPSNLNSGIEYFIQMEHVPVLPSHLRDKVSSGITDTRKTTRALTQILAQIIQEPCFHQLRTTEQLGYIVQSGVRTFGSLTGIKILVQSERDPRYIESRIESFLQTRIHNLLIHTMTEDDFRRQVQSLVDKKLKKDMKLREESARYWTQITNGFYDFQEVMEDVEMMMTVTLEDARAFFLEWILPGAPRVKKVSVHIRSQKLKKVKDVETEAQAPEENEKENNGEPNITESEIFALKEGTLLIKDVVAFKAGLELSRAPVPVIDLLRYSKL
jgi:insulysin